MISIGKSYVKKQQKTCVGRRKMSVSTYVRTRLCKHDVILICTARGWAHRGGVLQIYRCANSSLFGLTFSKLSPWTKQQALRYELFKDLWELLLNKNGVAVKNKRVNSVFCFHSVVRKWQDYHSQVDMWVVVYPFHIFFFLQSCSVDFWATSFQQQSELCFCGWWMMLTQ